jgi:hypothetical protein
MQLKTNRGRLLFKIIYFPLLLLLISCYKSPSSAGEEQPDHAYNNMIGSPSLKTTYLAEFTDPQLPWEERCGYVRQAQVGDITLPGKLVVYLAGYGDKLIEPDLSMHDLDIGEAYDLYVAPGGDWFSYWKKEIDGDRMKLSSIVFTSATQDEQYEIEWPDNWFITKLSPWFSSEYIELLEKQGEEWTRVLLSPTNERVILDWRTLPDITMDNPHLHAWFSPTLTHVVYQTNAYATDKFFDSDLVLWNLETGKKVWQSLPGFFTERTSISWAPDGRTIAFTARLGESPSMNFELYTLSVDGELKKVTNFDEVIEDYILTSFIWSMDSNRLLFAFGDRHLKNDWGTFPYRPVILELLSNSVIDLCVAAYDNFHTFQPYSIHNNMLIIVGSREDEENLLFIDVPTGNIQVLPFDICTTSRCQPSDDMGVTGVRGWLNR